MILTVKQYKQPNLDTTLEMRITGSVPTSAVITWLKNVENPGLGTNQKTVTVSNLGSNRFRLTAFVPAEIFWVKLNTETRKIKLENFFKSVTENDRPLAFTGTMSDFSLWVPYCDVASLKIEVFTVDGEKLDAWSADGPSFWFHYSTAIFNGYAKPRLCLEIRFTSMMLRQGDGAWRAQNSFASLYIRASGMNNVIQNGLLLSTIVEEDDYKVEYQDKKDKTKTKGTSWGVTVK